MPVPDQTSSAWTITPSGSTTGQPAFSYIPREFSDRHARLFQAALGWLIHDHVRDATCQSALRNGLIVLERFAEGQANAHELACFRSPLEPLAQAPGLAGSIYALACQLLAGSTHRADLIRAVDRVQQTLADLRRDPLYAPQALPTAEAIAADLWPRHRQAATIVKGWLTVEVRMMCRIIISQRQYHLVPILGDALVEAGCTDSHILEHCFDSARHFRGCWLLDAVLAASRSAQLPENFATIPRF
jgi:hypothetical protein